MLTVVHRFDKHRSCHLQHDCVVIVTNQRPQSCGLHTPRRRNLQWDFKFSRRRVWCSELSSGMYCRAKWFVYRRFRGASCLHQPCSMHLRNVGRQYFYTAVHPRRQFWASAVFTETLDNCQHSARPEAEFHKFVIISYSGTVHAV
jgi:hypothetical protein